MARLRALWRDTKYLIGVVVAAGVAGAYYYDPVALVLIPIALVPLLPFAMNRYDDQGNDREN